MNPEFQTLNTGYVDVWQFRVDLEAGQLVELTGLLSEHEQVRLKRLKVEQKRRQFIVTRARLRQILGKLLNIDPDVPDFDYSLHGKPVLGELWSGCGILFNVSHSHERALVAVTFDNQIGIDLEWMEHDRDHMGLAKRYFSEREQSDLLALPDEQRTRAFYACWTRKEAFVKAVGDGITYGLDAFSVSVRPEEERPSLEIHEGITNERSWSVFNIPIQEDYMAALVVAGDTANIRYWDPEQGL